MSSPLYALQVAIYQRLTNVFLGPWQTVGGVSCAVYDAVPENAVFPYVSIGDDTALDWSSKTTSGQEVTSTLHIWSQYRGMAEVKHIADEVIGQLSGSPLTLAGFKVDRGRLDMMETLHDPDGFTRHGVLRFRFFISEE